MGLLNWMWFHGGTYIHCGQCKYKTRDEKKIRRHFMRKH